MWKLNRPGVRTPGRCGFLSLSERLVRPVVTPCDEHETNHREPGDREGNVHVVVLSLLGPCSLELRPMERTPPEQSMRKVVLAERRSLVSGCNAGPADLLARSNPSILAKEVVVGLGDAPSNACMSGR
jgi:hypothetical protein